MNCSLPASPSIKRTGVSCHFLLQGIFQIQGLNPGLPHCRQMLYRLSPQESPWVCSLWDHKESDVTEKLTLLLLLRRQSRGVPSRLEEDPPMFTNLQPRAPLEMKSRVLETFTGRFLVEGFGVSSEFPSHLIGFEGPLLSHQFLTRCLSSTQSHTRGTQ